MTGRSLPSRPLALQVRRDHGGAGGLRDEDPLLQHLGGRLGDVLPGGDDLPGLGLERPGGAALEGGTVERESGPWRVRPVGGGAAWRPRQVAP